MAKPPASPLPDRVTAGQLAQLLGISERMVLARTSDGRLPRAAEGRVDLRAVVRAGVDSCAVDQRQRGTGRGTAREAREAREAAHVLERLGPWLLVQEAPERIAAAALGVGIPVEQAQALYGQMLTALPALANRALDRIECPPDPELGRFEALTHLPEPDWPRLETEAALNRSARRR